MSEDGLEQGKIDESIDKEYTFKLRNKVATHLAIGLEQAKQKLLQSETEEAREKAEKLYKIRGKLFEGFVDADDVTEVAPVKLTRGEHELVKKELHNPYRVEIPTRSHFEMMDEFNQKFKDKFKMTQWRDSFQTGMSKTVEKAKHILEKIFYK